MATAKRSSSRSTSRSKSAAARSGNPAVRAGAAGKPPSARHSTPATPKTPPPPKGPAIKPRLGHAHALTTGDKAPPFTLKTADGGKTSLNALRKDARKGIVIFFFPQAGSKACTAEAREFRDSYAVLHKAGYLVVGVSPDNPQDLARFKGENNLPFILASDPGSKVARKFGAFGKTHRYAVTATMPDQFHRAVPKVEAPLRATFVIDEEGRISQIVPSVQVKGHVGRLLKRLGLAS